jgi:hypothetical protein
MKPGCWPQHHYSGALVLSDCPRFCVRAEAFGPQHGKSQTRWQAVTGVPEETFEAPIWWHFGWQFSSASGENACKLNGLYLHLWRFTNR